MTVGVQSKSAVAGIDDPATMDGMDILADYREWRSAQPDRIGTHSDRCHLWARHERCMIHRLASALEAATNTSESLRREVREQRREIAALREERAALLAADRPKPDTL